MYKPKVIDLFCGVGGFSYGFKKAGYDIILGIDNEKSKLLTYEKNIASPTLNTDITQLSVKDIQTLSKGAHIDVIIGSPPCLEYSTSNPNKISKKERGINLDFPLSFNFMSIVLLLRPKVFVMENVNNFFKTRDAYLIEKIFTKFGYTTYINSINVKEFGIPQTRKRSFLIGTLLNREVKLVKPCNLELISLKDAIGDLEDLTPLAKNNLSYLTINQNYNFSDYQKKMHMKNKSLSIYNHNIPNHYPETIEKLKSLQSGMYHGKNKYHLKSHSYDLSKTITSKFATPSGDGETMHYSLPRCLTLREAARIQSFNDDFIFVTKNISNTSIGKMVGDAVPPIIAEIIARHISLILSSVK